MLSYNTKAYKFRILNENRHFEQIIKSCMTQNTKLYKTNTFGSGTVACDFGFNLFAYISNTLHNGGQSQGLQGHES